MNHDIAIKVSEYLLAEKYDERNIRFVKISYSVECILTEIEKLIGFILLFSLLDMLRFFAVCYITTIVIRSFAGGIHMKTTLGCFMFSVFVYGLAIYFGTHIVFLKNIYMCVLINEVICIAIFAPVPSKERPRYSKKQKDKFKIYGILGAIICGIYGFVCVQERNIVMCMMILQQIEMIIASINIRINKL